MPTAQPVTVNSGKMVTFLKVYRTWIMCIWVGLVAGVTLLPQFFLLRFVYDIEQLSYSFRLQIRGTEASEGDATKVIILAADARSLYPEVSVEDLDQYPDLEFFFESWPWDRAIHGIVADKLIQAGAKAVAFDYTFPTPNPGNADFLEMIEKYPDQIVLGYKYAPMQSQLVGDTRMEKELPIEELLPENIDNLLGFVNIEPDRDGTLRHARLTTNIYAQNRGFMNSDEAFNKLTASANRAPLELSLGARTAALIDPDFRSDLPPYTYFPLINYGGEAGFFTAISYIDVILEDRFESRKNIFKDAVVIAGPFDESFKDIVTTPLGVMFGVETHAHVLRSILTDSFYTSPSKSFVSIIVITFSLVLTMGILKFKGAWIKGLWLFGLTLPYLGASQIAFSAERLVLPIVPIIWVVVLGGFVLLIFDFIIDQYERQQLRGYLNRYVSPDVARILVEDRGGFDQLLKGASRPIAVLFSDIRGFTTLSERYTPEGLVAHLNEYFQSMVDSILSRRGSLNKYIGDAILAVWGDIYTSGPERDCGGAVSSAMEMVERLEALNDLWKDRDDRLPLSIGVGISHGEGFVGNMGHPNRMEVAVMGDVVNLGSRLEGATKQYGCPILVSEEVYALTKTDFHYQELDIIQVKGKTQGVRIYRPISAISMAPPKWFNIWDSALSKYRSRDFESAHENFTRLANNHQELKAVCDLYCDRCDELRVTPPPENWDYVFIMTTK